MQLCYHAKGKKLIQTRDLSEISSSLESIAHGTAKHIGLEQIRILPRQLPVNL